MVDGEGVDLVGEGEAEDAAVEIELAFECALVGHLFGELRLAELLAFHQLETDRSAARQPLRRQFQAGVVDELRRHQDGVTHWDSPEWDEGIHGFNFQVQLYPTSAGSCLWVVPGTHKLGKIDIKARIAQNGGSEQLSGALPLCCDAGDVTIVNRQLLHASFANSSPDLRVSVTFGFHRRSSVEGQSGALGVEADGVVYDEQRIFDRSAVVAVAIDARHQEYPDEVPFVYQPFVGLEDEFRLTDAVFERVIRDYNTRDLAI